MTTDEKIGRLSVYSKRLRGSLYQARSLYACFDALNSNKDLRGRVNRTHARHATNIFQNAVLRELILILVRVFDRPNGAVEKTNRVSFPVIALWLDQADVRNELLRRARVWLDDGFLADEHEASAREGMECLRTNLDRLAREEPNRQQRLRDFRNTFLAHELHLEVPRDPPLFGHIVELLDEVRLLCEHTSLAVEGTSIVWDMLDEEFRRSADWLWDRVASH